METKTIKGYKVADSNGKCRGFQFEVGKEYEHKGELKICSSGFHFCTKAQHCFSYYSFDSSNKVFEVEAFGDIQTHHEDSKVATNKLRILREIPWSEVSIIANEGINNTGHSNTGNRNTGNRNTGNSNTGNRNTGNSNTGDWNTGNSNTGYSNTGNSNTGNWNTGDWNTGNWNTGNRNTGNSNTGDSNTGNRNTGDWNTGNSNTGYSNTGNRNTGAFCTGNAPFLMFNKPVAIGYTEIDFENTRAYSLMRDCVDTKMWVCESQMTDTEKENYPSYKTAGGYLRDIPFKQAFQDAWHNWSSENRKAFTSLPNFDWDVFSEITGVNRP